METAPTKGDTENRAVVTNVHTHTHARTHTHTHTRIYHVESALEREDVQNGTAVTYTHILIPSGENP